MRYPLLDFSSREQILSHPIVATKQAGVLRKQIVLQTVDVFLADDLSLACQEASEGSDLRQVRRISANGVGEVEYRKCAPIAAVLRIFKHCKRRHSKAKEPV